MDWNERKIVLNYLQSLYLKEKKYGGFVILNKIYAKNKSIKKLDELSINDKETLLRRVVIDYLAKSYSESLLFDNVHNSDPNRRLLRIREVMYRKYDQMSSIERETIINKILNKNFRNIINNYSTNCLNFSTPGQKSKKNRDSKHINNKNKKMYVFPSTLC